ncbi:MAG: hypothetical protein NUV67_05660, partial [archaeon]|nr:hypothetical protein [archaeon]
MKPLIFFTVALLVVPIAFADCPLDKNADSKVDLFDMVFVAKAILEGDLSGDVDGSGTLGIADVEFVAARFGACGAGTPSSGNFSDNYSFAPQSNPWVELSSITRVRDLAGSYGSTAVSYAESINKASIVGLWTFNSFGGNIEDVSGQGNNGTVLGGATYLPTGGVNGTGAFSFSGSATERLRIDNKDPFQFGNTNFSMMAWVKPAAVGGSALRTFSNKGLFCYAQTDGVNRYTCFITGDSGIVAPNTLNNSITLNQWQHVVLTVNKSGNATMYLNGQKKATASATNSGAINSGAFFDIAGPTPWAPNTGFNGMIDEVAVWKRELLATEVSDLYNFGLGVFDSSFKSPTIPTSGDFYAINSSWVSTGEVAVDISTNNGATWCAVSNGGSLVDVDCLSFPANNFKYRVRMAGQSAAINSINFEWFASPLPECADGLDNDKDGAFDSSDYSCSVGATESVLAQCQNGTDDDSDGAIDLEDSGCE